MASSPSSFCPSSPCFATSLEIKNRLQVRAQSSASSGDSLVVKEVSFTKERGKNGELVDVRKKDQEINGTVIGGGNGRLMPSVEKKWMKDAISKDLPLMWDDGYRTKTIKEYLDGALEMIKPDGGPPRWFCPLDCGEPLKGSPVLLFLPGFDGVGLGLVLHHKALGKVFDVRCLHIPVYDRTPFLGLVKLVEETLMLEHSINPNKPIYLVGDSFGCCLALAVAARNPKIDLVLVLANPATSFGRSQLQPILPALEAFPNELHMTIPYLLSFVMGNPLKMAMADVEYKLPLSSKLEQLSGNLTTLLPLISVLANIIPKETLLWKLQLINSGSAYANSRLHAVKAEVLVLASGNDNMLPSGDEAERLKSSLKNCTVRYFKDNGHTLLMEDGIGLLTIIKGTEKYRRSRRHDHILDFIPPSISECRIVFEEVTGMFQWATGGAIFSTLENGQIVRGLAGVPDEGPVILVGYHMMMGMELYPLFEQFIREKKISLRGMAHPVLFSGDLEQPLGDFNLIDWVKVMGGLPVSGSNLFKLLASKSHVLLYPGGAREALHYKESRTREVASDVEQPEGVRTPQSTVIICLTPGSSPDLQLGFSQCMPLTVHLDNSFDHQEGEEYKLFWPDQPEFVRMAAKFGATIIPFGAVGEDDIAQYVLDHNDLIKVPFVNDYIRESQQKLIRVRDESQGEVANPDLFVPVALPKYPGRFYYLFGKPIRTEGMEEMVNDRENAKQMYLQIKSEVERILAYLLKKREEDPYRGLLDRTVYRSMSTSQAEVPAFDP